MLLKLKHWQLFLLTWGISLMTLPLLFFNVGWTLTLFPMLLIVSTINYFGWIWEVANRFFTTASGLNIRLFRLIFPIPVIYLILLELWILHLSYFGNDYFDHLDASTIALVIVPLHLASLIIIFWAIVFAAKSLKSFELGRHITFKECALDFLLIWFSVIGFWYLQPKIQYLLQRNR